MPITQSLKPMVFCGPSGAGKSTLLSKLFEDFPNRFGFSVSHTTRPPREGEQDGVHYHFTNREAIEVAIDKGEFLETATFCGNLYGTSKEAVRAVRDQGKICILDIDVQGVKQVKKSDLNPWYVFIKPPSLEELKKRLMQRKTETNETLAARLKVAGDEIQYGLEPGNFDYIFVNDNFETAYAEFRKFLHSRNIVV